MNAYTTSPLMQKRYKFRRLLKLILLFIFSLHFVSSYAQFEDESSHKGLSKKKWPPVIHKLSEIGLPESMVKRIRRYTKQDMDSAMQGGEDFHESYAEKDKNDVFEDYVVKVMLRFVGGSIVGFVKKENMMQTNQGQYVQTRIEIPIEWCALDSVKQEHCAKTPEEIKELDSIAKPKDWHQKLDPNEVAQNKVEDNFDLLQMLDSKKGAKKLKSKKMLDSLASIATNLTGDDSLFAVQKINKLQKELQVELRKKKGGVALDDSTLISITNGLSGVDSMNAIKSYFAMEKAQKDKRFIKAEKSLDSTTIASLTQGLSPTDSVKAIRKFLMGALATKRSKQTRGAPDKSNGAMPINPNDSTGLANPIPIFAGKTDKKKKKGDELDEATIAKVTNGLTGIDSVNALKEYKLELAMQNNVKVKDKKKKKGDEIDEATIAQVTNGLTGLDSVNALREYKLSIAKQNNSKDKKKKKGSPVEKVVTQDNVSSSNPTGNADSKSSDSATSTIGSQPVVAPTAPANTEVAPAAITPPSAKASKNEKKKKKGVDELDDATIATITKGLSGDDSIAAIRDYKLDAKREKDTKKKKGSKVIEQVIQDTAAKVEPTPAPVPATNVEPPVANPAVTKPKDSVVTPKEVALPEASTNGGRQRVIDSAALKEKVAKDTVSVVKPDAPPPVVPKVEEKAKEVVPTPPTETKPVVADTIKAVVPVEPKVEEKAKEVVPTPPAETKPVVVDTIKAFVQPVAPKVEEKAKEDTPTPPVETKPVATDSTKQAVVPAAEKDSTAVAPPVVPVESKPGRQRVEAVVPPETDSTINKQKLPSDSSITKPSSDTINGNKIVVPADTTKPK